MPGHVPVVEQENPLCRVLRALQGIKGNDVRLALTAVYGALEQLAIDGDSVSLEVCKEIARILEQPGWIDQTRQMFEKQEDGMPLRAVS
jgi:hypothetical protein